MTIYKQDISYFNHHHIRKCPCTLTRRSAHGSCKHLRTRKMYLCKLIYPHVFGLMFLCLIFLRIKKNVTDSYIESVTKCLCCWQVRNSVQIKDSQWICTVATQDWKSCVCVEACFFYCYSKVCIVVCINGCHIVFW